jgi:hypothetical protein
MLADYSQPPAQTPRAIRLSSLYLQDDFWPIEQMRPQINRIGYSLSARVLGAVLNRDASSAYRWTDVGEVLTGNGDLQRAEYCYRKAAELAPFDPQILLAAGNFYTTQGKTQAAVALFAGVLKLSNSGDILTHNVFVYYERLGVRNKGMLEQAIPDASNARAYLRYLIQSAPESSARGVWQWIRKKEYDDDPVTIEYVNFLVEKKQLDSAEDAWLEHFGGRQDGYSRTSPVFNGGFEEEFTGGLPDWHVDGIAGVKVKRDHASRFDGQYSLRVDFTGNDNPDFHHVQQTVFVEPGKYRFEAHARTSEITSEQGVGFRVVSLPEGKTLASTDALTGTNDWKRLDATFEIPRGDRMVAVQFTRRRSIRIDNQLTGTAWIDAVKLTRLQ